MVVVHECEATRVIGQKSITTTTTTLPDIPQKVRVRRKVSRTTNKDNLKMPIDKQETSQNKTQVESSPHLSLTKNEINAPNVNRFNVIFLLAKKKKKCKPKGNKNETYENNRKTNNISKIAKLLIQSSQHQIGFVGDFTEDLVARIQNYWDYNKSW